MKKITAIFLALTLMIISVPVVNISAETVFSSSEIYFIKNVFSGKYLETSGDNNSQVYQNTFNASEKQQFRFKSVKSGGVAIAPIKNDAVRFDVSGASTKNGTSVKLYKQNMDHIDAQHFKIKENSDGTYRLVSELSESEKVLEIGGPSKTNGASLQLWDYVGTSNQKWEIIAKDQADVSDSIIPSKVSISTYGTYFNMDSTKISMNVANYNSMPIITTDEFRLDTWRDGEWQEYSSRQYTKFEGKPFEIGGKTSYNFIADLMNASAKPLIEGSYRIVKNFTVKNSALPSFEKAAYFTAYNGIYTFSSIFGSTQEKDNDSSFRKSYFKSSTVFDEIYYTDNSENSTSYSSSIKDEKEIEKMLEVVLDITGTDVTSSGWNGRRSSSNPYYSITFVNYDDDYEITIGLCGITDNIGYLSMRRDNRTVMRLAVKRSSYNTLLEYIKEAF